MLLMIDNFDSFTYNLVQYFQVMDQEVCVKRNNAITVEECFALKPDAIIISPGPCSPKQAGISVELIKAAAGKIPLMGVCLGHQCIGEAFGGNIIKAKCLMHGKTSQVKHDGKGLFNNLRNPMKAGRYHSLAIERDTIPECLEITAETEDGEIMGVRHKEHLITGIQFHPESVLTPAGKKLMANFLTMANVESK